MMSRAAGFIRRGLPLIIAASWIVLVILMWRAYHTLPTAEELADARRVRPPLPMDLYTHIGMSFGEMLVMVLLAWPRERYFLLRVILAAIALIIWFFATVTMDLNTMEWLHRRWIAFVVLLLLLTAVIYPFVFRKRSRQVS